MKKWHYVVAVIISILLNLENLLTHLPYDPFGLIAELVGGFIGGLLFVWISSKIYGFFKKKGKSVSPTS